MLIGFNNDVEYRGKTFHIQTEDHGEGDPRIETQLFHSGAILDTVLTSYQEILDEYDGDEADERVRAQMKASHRSLFKKLKAGEYDEFAGLESLEDVDEDVAEPEVDDFTPSQDRIPAAAAQVEEEGEDAIMEFQKEKAKNHVSLHKLKDQLEDVDSVADEEDSEAGDQGATQVEDDVAPTQVLDPTEAGFDFSSVSDDSEQNAEQVQQVQQAAEGRAGGAGERPVLVDYESTGVDAWKGCQPPVDDLSLTSLVEEFLGQ
jgi:hypothetical protein